MGRLVRSVVVASLLATLLPFGAFTVRAQEPGDAQALLEQGRYRDALPALKAAVAKDAGNVEAVLDLSRAYAGLGRNEDAVRALEAALEKAPTDAGLLAERALQQLLEARHAASNPWKVTLAESRRQKALEWIDALRKAHPDAVEAVLVEARLRLHEAELELTDATEALELLEPLEKTHGDRTDVQFWLARARFALALVEPSRKDLFEAAAAGFSKVAEARPDEGLAAFYQARVNSWLGVSAKNQAKAYERAALMLGHDVDEKRATGQAIEWLRNYYNKPHKTMRSTKRLLEEEQRGYAVLRLHADALVDLNRGAKAIEAFEAALQEAPDDRFLALEYGRFLAQQAAPPAEGDGDAGAGEEGDPGASQGTPGGGVDRSAWAEKGVEHLLRAVDLCGGVLDRRIYDGVDVVAAHTEGLDHEQRDRIWTKLWETFPGEINAPGNAEVSWRNNAKDPKRSLEWCERALKVDPEDPMIHSDIGLAFQILERYEEAEKAYARAIEAAKKKGIAHPDKSRGYVNAVRNIIELMIRDERFDELRAYVDAQLKDDPKYETILEIIDEVQKKGKGTGEAGAGGK